MCRGLTRSNYFLHTLGVTVPFTQFAKCAHWILCPRPVGLGDGCTALDHKLTAVLHQIKILVGGKEGAVKLFCLSVLSYLSDFGTEASIPSVARPTFIATAMVFQTVRNNVLGCERF